MLKIQNKIIKIKFYLSEEELGEILSIINDEKVNTNTSLMIDNNNKTYFIPISILKESILTFNQKKT